MASSFLSNASFDTVAGAGEDAALSPACAAPTASRDALASSIARACRRDAAASVAAFRRVMGAGVAAGRYSRAQARSGLAMDFSKYAGGKAPQSGGDVRK